MSGVTLTTGRRFAADPSVSILDAARAAGITLEYSCRTGRCGACAAPLVAGDTRLTRPELVDMAPGTILTCCRAAVGDVVLDVEPLDRLAGIDIRTMPARIVSIEHRSADIAVVVLRTPPASPLRFVAGQYVDLIAAGVRRSYSLANAPRADALLELIVRRYPGGQLSGWLFDHARPGDLVRIEGPFGTFFLRDEAPRDLLFLATGTGIAPVKAVLEELAADPLLAARHEVRVFWGNRAAEDFCWRPAASDLDVAVHHLLSGADAGWDGRRGYVQDAALADGVDVAQTMVLACGSSAMIADARDRFAARGLPPRRFLSDAFVSSN